MRPTLIIFVKEPRPGRVKTRLARDIGSVHAAWWFRHQATALVRKLARDRRWRTVLAVSPDRAGVESRVWPTGIARWPQGVGDLGRRMARAFDAMGPGPVVIIGADIPGVTPVLIAGAFHRLRGAEAVLGPATDGGYWLIGLRHAGPGVPARLLDGVRWSGRHAMVDTLRCLAPRRVAFAPTLDDVDRLADLERLGLPQP